MDKDRFEWLGMDADMTELCLAMTGSAVEIACWVGHIAELAIESAGEEAQAEAYKAGLCIEGLAFGLTMMPLADEDDVRKVVDAYDAVMRAWGTAWGPLEGMRSADDLRDMILGADE